MADDREPRKCADHLQFAAARRVRRAVLDGHRRAYGVFAGAHAAGKAQLAGDCFYDSVYDAAVYCVDGLGPVHAEKGLFQQLFPATGSWSEGFFCFGGLVLVMSLHVFPFLMTMLKNAMLNIPASLE